MIEINHLSKTYDKTTFALRDINLSIGKGLFGLLGPNGAGKTTFMRIVVGLLKPSGGKVSVFGFNPTIPNEKLAIRKILGYLPQELGLYLNFTAAEYLNYIAELKGVGQYTNRKTEIERVLSIVNLSKQSNTRLHKLSGGMKRRVGIAQALIGNPQLLIVDEPTAGLDPEERVNFRNMLSEVAQESIVIFSTHTIEDVNLSCNQLAIIAEGRILYNGTPKELIDHAIGNVWTVNSQTPPSGIGFIVTGTVMTPQGNLYRVVGNPPLALNPQTISPTIEESYLYLINEHRIDG